MLKSQYQLTSNKTEMMMQRMMTAVNFKKRGDAFLAKGELDNAIADYTQAIQINPNYALAKENLTNLLAAHRKTNIFNAIKQLPNEKQIPLLIQCLNKDTLLGAKFWEKNGFFECNLAKGTLKEIDERLSDLLKQMITWLLTARELFCNQRLDLVPDIIYYITSCLLQVNGLGLCTVNKCTPKTLKFPMTMFQENKMTRGTDELNKPISAIGMHNTL